MNIIQTYTQAIAAVVRAVLVGVILASGVALVAPDPGAACGSANASRYVCELDPGHTFIELPGRDRFVIITA